MKKIILFTTIFFVFASMQCLGAEYVKGNIIGNLDKKLKIVYGDKAVVSLGSNHGVIKGDILNITKPSDLHLANSLGKCAVQRTFESTSICEIIRMTQEIEAGQVVSMEKLRFNDPGVFPEIFAMLQNLVEPYPAYKDISIYVYDIFDENRNITQFSESLKKELKYLLSQKKRIKFVSEDVGRLFEAYSPSELSQKNKVVEGYMKKGGIDAIIAGHYEAAAGKVLLTLFKIDNNWDVVKRQVSLNAAPYGTLLTVVTVPYSPKKKEQNVICNLVYKPVRHMPLKTEKQDYIQSAAQNDPFVFYNLGRVDFNVIGPVDFKLKVDNDVMDFEKQNEFRVALQTGRHEITASFKTGFYFNETLMFTSPSECKGCRKTVVLQLDKDAEVNIEVSADPLYGRERIDFNIYTKVVTGRPILKPILKTEKVIPIETFKD